MRRVKHLSCFRRLVFGLVFPASGLLTGGNAIQGKVGLKVSLPRLINQGGPKPTLTQGTVPLLW